MEQAQFVLGLLVKRHDMLVPTALLRESTHTIVDPFVAVFFLALLLRRRAANDAIDAILLSPQGQRAADEQRWSTIVVPGSYLNSICFVLAFDVLDYESVLSCIAVV